MLQDSHLYFLLILPVLAFLYASVGHGGASGYLALMALFSFSPAIMKPTALLLNLFVAAVSFLHFYRSGHFSWRLFYPFAIASIPLAFVGGLMEVDAGIYKKILGVLLMFAVYRLFRSKTNSLKTKDINILIALIVGGAIGFFSGLIGIGGGIILTPVILLFSWGNVKQAAAVSALFIWMNSGAGLIGQLQMGIDWHPDTWLFVSLALVGGILGGYLGSKKMNSLALRITLGSVLGIAAIKLFFNFS